MTLLPLDRVDGQRRAALGHRHRTWLNDAGLPLASVTYADTVAVPLAKCNAASLEGMVALQAGAGGIHRRDIGLGHAVVADDPFTVKLALAGNAAPRARPRHAAGGVGPRQS